MSDELKGAVALVTGAGGGIGRAICTALSAAGAHVVAADRHWPADAAPVAGEQAVLDVCDPDAWFRLMQDIRQRHGRLDVLVNNAGISLVASIAETSLEQWRRCQAVNVEGTLLGIQAALPLLRDAGAARPGGASIINISSVGGLRGAPFNAAYCTSKAAVLMLSKSAALEFCALGYPIRVNTVHPGAVGTAMMQDIIHRYVELGAMASLEQATQAVNAMHPIGRQATPAEIAAGVLFLASPASSYMVGSELVIDGGYTSR
ncbi:MULTISPECIES: SDR family oxidoreductase [unclassified Azospirillum]|uniref:SDR family oxidoreductase n=1 Tax=unclassified Azospirillum TaxID=2630922 RepID=UPI000B63D9C2|nr:MULTISPECIES: SDR family oxidoreductase [unclassified Azospirillum]SNT14385.1 NAD(P)-dependent dehydrogenase, short-chain alcohol dehydrogenase family [Azospirillum sp. RU38E]SNT27652.1 NAD(P)-dependent dehydrogenase, short-chain alcohol dehydrogenase family [Azospirillum sp. RU37A]